MLNLLYYFYFSCPEQKVFGHGDFWAKLGSFLFRRIAPFYYRISGPFCSYGLRRNTNNDMNIVSLTSFPNRINNVWLTIESILRQKEKPDKILLWLYEGEFSHKNLLPKNLLRLEKRGLEIRFCNENLMPHKKYLYTHLEYPTANIITIDDDMFYPRDLLAKINSFHKKYPNSILCPITRKIKIVNNKLVSYKQWDYVKENSVPLFMNLTMGGGGTLFPANSLHADTFDIINLKRFALKADDLWLKIMSLRNNTKVASLAGEYPRFFIPVCNKNNINLMDSNIGEGQNDLIFKNLMEHYKISVLIFDE